MERTCLSNYGKRYFYFFILCSTRAALLLFHIYFIKHRFVCLLRQYRFRTFYCSIIFPFSSKLPLLFYAKGNFLYLFSILFQLSCFLSVSFDGKSKRNIKVSYVTSNLPCSRLMLVISKRINIFHSSLHATNNEFLSLLRCENP